MGFWIIYFEMTNLAIFIGFLIYLIVKKHYRQISTLLVGSIFGVTLEFINVLVFANYYYNPGFLIQVGGANNIPIIIGLSWGMLLTSAREITKNYTIPKGIKALFEAIFVVSVDLFLDVVAVRIEGGFWTWIGIPLSTEINYDSIIGIPWGNYFGWFCVVFYSSLVLYFIDKRFSEESFKVLSLRTIIGVIGAEILLFVSLLLALVFHLIHAVSLLFLIPYFGGTIFILIYFIRTKTPFKTKIDTWFPCLFFFTSYLFCLITMITLGLVIEIPWYFALLCLFMGGSIVYLVWRTYKKREK
ncbi:MAG: carotenoid biosynthesis protein [Promethearchaeota archaeon]|nr:MAG: carotenoid biosynthesis protein [Candidatus Lokiarchaeota archaeon]